ncbi:carbohydrate sulfotransferase 3-like isoform X1 [Styela clava]
MMCDSKCRNIRRIRNKITLLGFVAVAFCLAVIVTRSRNHTLELDKGSVYDIIKSEELRHKTLAGIRPEIKYDFLNHFDHGIHPSRVVIILATKRSGSTLLGEFFNQNRGCFYLFEPLFPFTRYCNVLRYERVLFLERLSKCNFTGLSSHYANAFRVTQHTDEHSKCLEQNICFSQRNMKVLYRYSAACGSKNIDVQFDKIARFVPESPCGYPLNVSILSSLCSSAELVTYKIIRVCDMKDLDTLVRRSDVTMIYLVRDPRATIASRLQLENDELTNDTFEFGVKKLCTEISENLYYSSILGNNTGFILVRYEDIVTEPLKNAYRIYRLIGQELPTSVKLWITTSFLGTAKKHKASDDPYSTVKFGLQSLNSWRQILSLQQTVLIQKYCTSAMKVLGYTFVNSYQEQHNWSRTLWKS